MHPVCPRPLAALVAVVAAVALAVGAAAQQVLVFGPAQGAPPSFAGADWLGGDPPARVTVVVGDCIGIEALRDAAPYLDELQRRYGGDGLRAVVVVDAASAAPMAGAFRVVVDPGAAAAVAQADAAACLLARDGAGLWCGSLASGLSQLVEDVLAGKEIPREAVEDERWRLESIGDIEQIDTAELQRMADAMIARNPRNAHGWVLRFLIAVERDADLDAARGIAAEACKQMALESAPLACFVDRMLRTLPGDRVVLQQALMALVPVAAAARDDLGLQCLYLRVLNGLGRAKEAGRFVAELQKAVAARPQARAAFAEALANGVLAADFADVATAAIEGALADAPDDSTLRMIHLLVLERCRKDADAARAALDWLMRGGNDTISQNSAAWYLMVQEPTRGRFNRVALALAERMVASGDLDSAEQDTVAMAYFLNGRIEAAIELQTVAARASQQPDYERRLRRYRKAIESPRPATSGH